MTELHLSDDSEKELRVLEDQYEDLQEQMDDFICNLTDTITHLMHTDQLNATGFRTIMDLIEAYWQEDDKLHGK